MVLIDNGIIDGEQSFISMRSITIHLPSELLTDLDRLDDTAAARDAAALSIGQEIIRFMQARMTCG